MLVVDASAAMSWCFEDEFDARAEAWLEHVRAEGALIPPLWFSEVTNALLMAERRGRTTQAKTARYVEVLEDLPLEVIESDPDMADVVHHARQFGLTTYDATYLLIAMQSGLALATRDAALTRAAEAAGVRLA